MPKITYTKEERKELDQMANEFVTALNLGVLKDTCIFSVFFQNAIKFSIKTHEVYQKQKRKGKDIPYIVHPLTVGLILSKAGAPDHVIVGGILHDTIEDSIEDKKVTYEMIQERFGSSVADIVNDVTEQNKSLPWRERKQIALEHIEIMEKPSLWVKTADVICNISDLLVDYKKDGEKVFDRFNASKEDSLLNNHSVLKALIKRWEDGDNPLLSDLKVLLIELERIMKDMKIKLD